MDALEKKARKRVNRGAEYMDATYPNWYRRIDTERLDLSRTDRCILGQLNGSYFDAPEMRQHSDLWLARRGFGGWTDDWPAEGQLTPWGLLTAEWQRLIRKRAFSAAASGERPVQQLRRAAKAMRERHEGEWTAIANWIDSHAHDLMSANGNTSFCDSPGDVQAAAAVRRVRDLCDIALADDGTGFEDPTPIPGWTTLILRALDGGS